MYVGVTVLYIPGAAFVRMATKAQAMQAIAALHQSQTMPVSWADAEGEPG